MLAFHNEHIASCAFLTYFTPESTTTASTSPTALTTATAAAASILNDKQAITGIYYKNQNLQLKTTKRPYMETQVFTSKQISMDSSKNFKEPASLKLIEMPANRQQYLDQLSLKYHFKHYLRKFSNQQELYTLPHYHNNNINVLVKDNTQHLKAQHQQKQQHQCLNKVYTNLISL